MTHAPLDVLYCIFCPEWIIVALTSAALGTRELPWTCVPVACQPSRKYCLTRAAPPAHVGVAMLVPLMSVIAPSVLVFDDVYDPH